MFINNLTKLANTLLGLMLEEKLKHAADELEKE